uniref:BHLH domain-containing protein n=1 Tax=Panagrellus redivivus TaxID=6233 RepID=A0A7E4ZZQ8_PANRE
MKHYNPPMSLLQIAGCDATAWNPSNQVAASNGSQFTNGNGAVSSSHYIVYPEPDYNRAQHYPNYDSPATVNGGTSHHRYYEPENNLQPSENAYYPVMSADHDNGYQRLPPYQTMIPSGEAINSQEVSKDTFQFTDLQPGQHVPSYQYHGSENNLQPSAINGCSPVMFANHDNWCLQLPPNQENDRSFPTPMFVDTTTENSYPNSTLPSGEPQSSMLSPVKSIHSNQIITYNARQFTVLQPVQHETIPSPWPPEASYGAASEVVGINHDPTYFHGQQNSQNQRWFNNTFSATIRNGAVYQNYEDSVSRVPPAEHNTWNPQPAPTQTVYDGSYLSLTSVNTATPVPTLDANSYQSSPFASDEYEPSTSSSSEFSPITSPSLPPRRGRPKKVGEISPNANNVRRFREQNTALDEEVKKHGGLIIYTALCQGVVLPENYEVAVTEMAKLHKNRYRFPKCSYSKFLFSTTGPGRKTNPKTMTNDKLKQSQKRIQLEAGIFFKLLKEVSLQLKKIKPETHTKLLEDVQRNSPNLYEVISKQ